MTRQTLVTILILFACSTISAAEYPDSVMAASKEEYRIEKGLNFDITGGVGLSRYEFHHPWVDFTSPHTSNAFAFPTWTGGVGINGYFLPWMGLGAGIHFSTYSNKSKIGTPWTYQGKDYQGQDYVLTSTSSDMVEQQGMYMLEVPVTLRFRAIKRNVGFHAALGGKVGMPIYDYYRMTKGALHNEVTYEHWALTMYDAPEVIEDASISPISSSNSKGLRMLNYAAYLELGMLIRLQQRLDLLIALSGTYYVNDVMTSKSSTDLGFSNAWVTGEYPSPFTAEYKGVLVTNEVQELHPWNVALKLGLSINAGKTRAQREYLRQRREEERAARLAALQKAYPDTVVIVQQVPAAVDSQQRREEAIKLIVAIARKNGVNLEETFCPSVPVAAEVHDTVIITLHDTIRVVDTVVVEQEVERPVETVVTRALDAALQTAIIWFRLDDSTPILQPEDILEQIADILKRHPEQKIQLNGHACELGRKSYNQRLALKRAKAVADELRKLGVKDEQMIVRSLGEDEPFRYNSKHQLHKDRRVEIIPVP